MSGGFFGRGRAIRKGSGLEERKGNLCCTGRRKTVELLIAFEALKEFYSPRGILLEFHELVAIAEQVLGIRIKNFRQLKKTVLDRGKSVVLLKQLERLIEQVRDGMDK